MAPLFNGTFINIVRKWHLCERHYILFGPRIKNEKIVPLQNDSKNVVQENCGWYIFK